MVTQLRTSDNAVYSSEISVGQNLSGWSWQGGNSPILDSANFGNFPLNGIQDFYHSAIIDSFVSTKGKKLWVLKNPEPDKDIDLLLKSLI